MPVRTNGLKTSPARTEVRGLLIVARDHPELYQSLQYAFGDSAEVAVILDRRTENRRRRGLPVPADRRRKERRSLPHIADDPGQRQYVLVRPHFRRPLD